MNKVFNWTIGSFFRTIGRMLAFFIVGIAIAYILAQSDLNIGNIFRYTLGVHASTFTPISSQFYLNGGSTAIGYSSTYDLYYESINSPNSPVVYFSMMPNALVNPSAGPTVPSGTVYANFRGVIRQRSSSYNDIECSQVSGTNGEYCSAWNFNNKYNFTLTLGQYDSGGGYPTTTCYLSVPNFGYADSSNGIGFTAKCPVYSTTIRLQYVRFNFNGTYFSDDIGLGLYLENVEIGDTQSIINNQNQNTQEIIDNQNENHEEMMDSNTTQAEDDAEDFFDSFDAPDIGGLSAIVTAPLNTIRSLLNSTCTNLVLPLPFVNKNLTLPCMNDIYTEHFGAFFSLYQTIILGIIAYRCIRSIFFDLQGFANPSDDRIEVMDL